MAWSSPDYTEVPVPPVGANPTVRLSARAFDRLRPTRSSTVERPEIILAPGPTPIPPEVLLAQGSPLVYHRGPGFGNIMRTVTARLKQLYRTDTAEILLLTSSGTGGLESAVQNLFSPGDEVLVPLAGFFAGRWKALAEAYGLTVRTIEYPWGTRIRPDDVARALAEHPVKAVLLTQSETSTGVIQPVRELAAVAREAGALVVCDVVSGLGAVPFEFDAWGIDVAVGGSQKALSASPGIAFVAISDRARAAAETATNPRYYFDWRIYETYARLPDPENPWTPAISVMQGLAAALELYFQDGVEAAHDRHRLLSRAVKEGVKALGLDLVRRGARGELDRDRDPRSRRDRRRHDHRPDPGRLRLRARPRSGAAQRTVFRIGHFGYVSELDIIRGLAALEMTLDRLGHPVKPGAAVGAAEQVFLEPR